MKVNYITICDPIYMDKYIIGYIAVPILDKPKHYAKITEVNVPEGQNTLKLFKSESKNESRRLYHLFKTYVSNDLIKKGAENAQ